MRPKSDIQELKERATYNVSVPVDLSTVDFVRSAGSTYGFFINIGVSGTLRVETFDGQTVEKTFPVGDYTVMLRKVYHLLGAGGSPTASDISAEWN